MTYPRVLFLHMTKVREQDPQNLLVRTLFGGWPKENLAQIYTGCYRGTGEFCGSYFQVGVEERRLGGIFSRLKQEGVRATSGTTPGSESPAPRPSIRTRLSALATTTTIESGVWEMVFSLRMSENLRTFIRGFRPDIIYTQGYSVGITNLALRISEEFSVPICYLPVDDWHSSLYRNSPVHLKVASLAKEVAQRATVRLALGPKMAKVLTDRYGVPFDCIYNADDFSRFPREPLPSGTGVVTIGFAGSLYLGRVETIGDLLNACRALQREFKIKVFCPSVPSETPAALRTSPNVEFLPLPSHSELPGVLRTCDILFLPESFDESYRGAIELSLSSKCPLYMMSGRPVLVYAPSWSGSMYYAKEFKWGVTVEERANGALAHALERLLVPEEVRALTEHAMKVARENHAVESVRTFFLNKLVSIESSHFHKPQLVEA
jgi:glycosyltransferase involved in cell wall biosynthesis